PRPARPGGPGRLTLTLASIRGRLSSRRTRRCRRLGPLTVFRGTMSLGGPGYWVGSFDRPFPTSGSFMKKERVIAVRRLLAFAVDWFLVVLWGGVLFGAVTIATGGNPPRPENPWKAQGISLLAMTLPVILYFALCESSAMRASVGKRTLGLVVS